MEMKSEDDSNADWEVKDIKAFVIIAQGVKVKNQSKIAMRILKEV